ncbi:uncharacterized protein LOC134284408, partial [Aedes albopictus]|uniref:Reverse transcriptase domain-containing protein n=1 Tax=Aedes albopictus TaxID=7160 RepID=A0ABM1Z6E6_AEDAL
MWKHRRKRLKATISPWPDIAAGHQCVKVCSPRVRETSRRVVRSVSSAEIDHGPVGFVARVQEDQNLVCRSSSQSRKEMDQKLWYAKPRKGRRAGTKQEKGDTDFEADKSLAEKGLGNIVGKTGYHVINSFEFAEEVTGMQVPEEHVLFSLDVKSLYTNVPVAYALECIEARWDEVAKYTRIDKRGFLAAVELTLNSTFFVYRGVSYSQTFGVPMGSPLSPVIANLVMERLEQESIRKLEGHRISMVVYRRYVDDCFCIARKEHVGKILEVFNGFHDRLQFTVEYEEDGRLKFLDMMLFQNNGRVEKTWLPKQENGRYLDYNSESPFTHKRNTAIALANTAIKLTDAENRPQAIDMVKRILKCNNYPEWFIVNVLKQRVHKHYNRLEDGKEVEET